MKHLLTHSFVFKMSPFHAAEIQHELARLSEKVPFLIPL